jgi:CDP-Glycerol:Poly(glycerophosphate) glycerophosphotransferase
VTSAPTVLISVPHGASAGNMLRHGLLGRLLAADRSLRIVIASPLTRDAGFSREFSQPGVSFEDQRRHAPSGLEARLQALMQAAYLESGITESVRIRRAEAHAKGLVRWVGAKARLARWMAPSLVDPATRYDLSDRFVSHPDAESLFTKHAPVLLVTSSPGLIFSEVPLLRTAVRRGVRTIAIDPSWDNFTNKLLPVRRVDRLLVWNDLMRDQAVQFHGYRSEAIRLCGAPQFDGYFRGAPPTPRGEFFRRIGADPDRKLITLTTTPLELYPYHADVVRRLSRAIESGAMGAPAQLLVRLHPRDQEGAYHEVRRLPHVIVEKPFRPTVQVADGLAVDVMPEHQRHLADTMRHSDVAVNVASTITIEACVFDTPVVNIAFDGDAQVPFERSARRYYRFTHYTNITRHEAVRVSWTPDELVENIARYLADPALDAEARRRVVAEQVQFVDGRSGERVARAVVDELAQAAGLSIANAGAEPIEAATMASS